MSARMIVKLSPYSFKEYVDDYLESVSEEIADLLNQNFENTVQSWSTQVLFKRSVRKLKTGFSIEVSTTNKLYALINNGAQSHYIFPLTLKGLWYQKNFTAKTQVRWLSSRSGGKYGKWVRRNWVRHPGHAPREFDKAVVSSIGVLGYVQAAVSQAVGDYNRDNR